MSSSRWPSAVDYQSALQSPATCFSDTALKRGLVMTNPMGLPLAASGNMVVVFRMTLDEGDVAIRCFSRQNTSEVLQRRYLALEAIQEHCHLPALVKSCFLQEALLVNGRRVPIVKMEWVRGLHLHRFTELHLRDAPMLHALADQWRILMAQLRTARFAHGDLSDGNVLVDRQGRFRLVDYDAAYLPVLANESPHELGKPNYQHPRRLRSDSAEYGYYAENMDAFGALVIYLSLRALALDPKRWDRYHTGENILFVQDDFEQPDATTIWDDLRSSKDDELLALTDALAAYCQASLSDLPSLEDVLRSTARPMQSIQTDLLDPDAAPLLLPAANEVPETEDAAAVSHLPILPLPFWKRKKKTVLGASALFSILLGLFVWMSVRAADPMLHLSADQPALHATDLAGLYTGFATLQNGEQEAVALLIDDVEDKESLKYSINWKSAQSGGRVRFDQERGTLDLEHHYTLYIASTAQNTIILETRSDDSALPRVKVTRTKLH